MCVLTVVDPFAYWLEDLDVECCGAAVVPIVVDVDVVVVLFEGSWRSAGYAWDDGVDVEGEDGLIGVDLVWMEDLGEVEGG